ncbi:hypothetical protein [Bacillus mycoides]|uniref:hypothetical protein n=1 Tax=Bacillus mycoides TaxID=1405 RepID=UPI0037F3E315
MGENWYRTNEDKALKLGTLYWEADKYFFDKKTGKSLFSIRKSGNRYYGYSSGGSNATLIQGFKNFAGKTFYFGKSNDGTGLTEGELASDWKEIDGNWYYFDSNGEMASSDWQMDYEFQWYYLNSDGKMAIGWKAIDGKAYYFNSKGIMAVGRIMIDGKSYFFSELAGRGQFISCER